MDPVGLYFDGSVGCEFEGRSIGSYVGDEPVDFGPPPMKVARELITGLRSDDTLRVAGYPEQDDGSVVVIRDGEVVVRYTFWLVKGEPWWISAASVCPDTGLVHAGESFS